jgi:hypothetical protein
MATYSKRKNGDGWTTIIAQVRVRPFKPVAKAFDKHSDAKEWAEALQRGLCQQFKRGHVNADLTRLTIAQLVEQFRSDPENQSLRYFDSLELLLAWWVNHCGAEKVLDLYVLKLRKAREKLRQRRKAATVNRYLSALRSCWNWGRAAGPCLHGGVAPRRVLR